MERWMNKVAVVTGASSGIGAAIVNDLLQYNLIVVGLARRVERIEEIGSKLPSNLQTRLHAIKCDIRNEDEVLKAFEYISKKIGGVDILINNAGTARIGNLLTLDSQSVRDVVDTNLLGMVYCTREAFKSLKLRNAEGHIILMNSIFGHKVPHVSNDMPSFNIYAPTKHAVTALNQIYRQECVHLNAKVKVTSISPGLVDTEMPPEDLIKMGILPILKASDVSNAVIYVLGTPQNVQISELTIQPLGERM